MTALHVPAWPGLAPAQLWSARGSALPFPLRAPRGVSFYRARNAIYHLVKALDWREGECVAVPDYHSGNEVAALRAAGATVRFYPIRRDLQPDLDALAQLCRRHRPRALLTIHYLGWPQPLRELAALCREHSMLLIEDCALALLSEPGGRALGSHGDYAVYCLYKTLPLPNGGLLVQNGPALEALARLELRPCGLASVGGRTAELLLERLRGRTNGFGESLGRLKGAIGRRLTALGVQRIPVGDIGFDAGQVDIAMSPLSKQLLHGLDYDLIRETRRRNFLALRERLDGWVPLAKAQIEDGVCPLFFPMLVADKAAAARALRRRGVAAVEFWNRGDPAAEHDTGPDARFLRDHLLELPLHQDVSPAQVDYMAAQVLSLKAACRGIR